MAAANTREGGTPYLIKYSQANDETYTGLGTGLDSA